jgi:hypothetical protein
MKRHRLFPVVLVFFVAVPAQGLEPVNLLLQAATQALRHYQQLASGIHCEDATTAEVDQDCKERLEGLDMRVREAQAAIARYRQFSTPQVVDLFDAYEAFRRVMEEIESLVAASDFYGEQNRPHLAEIYNSFVKVTGWFGNVLRETIQDADKCSERGATVSFSQNEP